MKFKLGILVITFLNVLARKCSCICSSDPISMSLYLMEHTATIRVKIISPELCTFQRNCVFRNSLVYLISSFIVRKLIGPSVNAAP